MKKSEVQVGQTYMAKVSGQLVPVKIISAYEGGTLGTHRYQSGWMGVNMRTHRAIRIRSAARLRAVAKHALVIHSLRDMNAECLCGQWHLIGTSGSQETDDDLRDRIRNRYRQHLGLSVPTAR